MEIAGYQSDIKTTTTNVFNEDKYHAEKSVAEFGVTTGTEPNVYNLSLNPKLTKPYEKGLRLQVVFHKPNTGAITLNVDGKGAVQVIKLDALCPIPDSGSPIVIPDGENSLSRLDVSVKQSAKANREGLLLEPLKESDIGVGVHYILVYDGARFQMINHVPECAPIGAVPPPSTEVLPLNETIYQLEGDRIGPGIESIFPRFRITAINKRLIVPRDIRVKKIGVPGKLENAIIRLPKPRDTYVERTSGALQSIQGNNFYYEMDRDGLLEIIGETTTEDEEIIVTFSPYLAKFPLEWEGQAPVSRNAAKADTPKLTVKKTKTTRTRATRTKKK